MDCIQGAFESSLTKEKGMKTTQQALLDDLPTVNGQGCVSGEESFVDDLLDFSNGFAEEEMEEQDESKKDSSVSPTQEEAETDNHSKPSTRTLCTVDDLSSIPCSELTIPAEDLANLEWLSHFVEDSFSEYPLTYPAGKLPDKPKENISVPEIAIQSVPCFTTPIQTKVRTKRARAGCPVWSPSLTESSSTSSSSSSSTSFSPPNPNPRFTYTSPGQSAEWDVKIRPEKKRKRKPAMEESGLRGGSQPRRCCHCGVHKTPQWRAGPLGAKTLCNACGVRYKSGRLLPEYRPACSPTFSRELHSNNHRKVLELRRKKEVDAGSTLPVRSF